MTKTVMQQLEENKECLYYRLNEAKAWAGVLFSPQADGTAVLSAELESPKHEVPQVPGGEGYGSRKTIAIKETTKAVMAEFELDEVLIMYKHITQQVYVRVSTLKRYDTATWLPGSDHWVHC